MTTEASLMPVAKGALPDARRVLVLAPHADDEVFGCGGALALHVAAGAEIKVIVLSDGAFGAAEAGLQAALREAESQAAAAVLGYPSPEFWRLPDRGIEYGEVLVGRLIEAARAHAADLIYATSLYEVHPDHRALAMAAVEAVRRLGQGVRLAMYEVGAPLRPNLLLDISAVFERKREAMRCFVSQLARQRYDEHVAALNRYRTYTLPPDVVAAEAFELHEAEEIERGLLAIYSSESERQRQCGVAVTGASDAPLISVIIRSMDRPTLARALGSLALQTYPNIEVIVVNARGGAHSDLSSACGRFSLRMLNQGGPALARSRAANAGLEAVQGRYFAFLDDDDSLDPEHFSTLMSAAQEKGGCTVVYSGVRGRGVDSADSSAQNIFAETFDAARLLAGNFIPIHAPLVPGELLQKGVRFDEALSVYEDWDFWLQLSELAPFALVDAVTATYYVGGNSGVNPLTVDEEAMRQATLALYAKWHGRFGHEALWQLSRLFHHRNRALHDTHMELAVTRNDLGHCQHELGSCQHNLNAAEGRLALLEAELNGVYNSRSWRITAPLRAILRRLRLS